MNKKIGFSIGGVIILAIAYWLISPLWRTVALDESLPTASGEMDKKALVQDNMDTMDQATKAAFEKESTQMKDVAMKKGETMPSASATVLGPVVLVPRAHGVEGSALIVSAGGKNFLRFENLKTINGPDLRIYLSSDLSAKNVVDLGPIRATEGNVNYEIPAGTDLSVYKNAMIWCRTFGVLFNYASF